MLRRINHRGLFDARNPIGREVALRLAAGVLAFIFGSWSAVAEVAAAAHFRKEIQPLLSQYCYDCHGDGEKKGNVAFDELKIDDALLNHDLWLKVLKNTRAGLMPPAKKPRPSSEQQQKLEQWIKSDAFGIDAQNPDPGRVTVRRLNRVEYRNTIRDLTGFDFKVDEEFPPDDTGYGFDTIGDVLSVSPLLLEKYMDAAKVIAAGVPRVAKAPREQAVLGPEIRRTDGGPGTGDRFTFFRSAKFAHTFT